MPRRRLAIIGRDYQHQRLLARSMCEQHLPLEEGVFPYTNLRHDDSDINMLSRKSFDEPSRIAKNVALRDRDMIILQFDASSAAGLDALKQDIDRLKELYGTEITTKLALVGTYEDASSKIELDELSQAAESCGAGGATQLLISVSGLRYDNPSDIEQRFSGVSYAVNKQVDDAYALVTADAATARRELSRAHQSKYTRLWSSHTASSDTESTLKQKMIVLLSDYAKGDSGLRLFCTLHANRNRHATRRVNEIVKKLRGEGNQSSPDGAFFDNSEQYEAEDVYRALCKIPVNEGGSLHSRLIFLKEKLLESRAISTTDATLNAKVQSVSHRIIPIRP